MLKRIAIICAGAFALSLPAAAQDAASTEGTIWAGIGDQAQVDRGKAIYSGICGKCHGPKGNGAGEPDQPESPAVARATFLTKWDFVTLDALFEYIRTEMPPDNPGSQPDQAYVDAMAYMLTLSEVPVGTTELPADPEALAAIMITKKPE
jgi:S-disulfanyl-L-cysteine oxidoreductase SoxD